MAQIIAYLENLVEATIGLPSDLARFLNMIRVLDERAGEVMDALKAITDALTALPPVGSATPEQQQVRGCAGVVCVWGGGGLQSRPRSDSPLPQHTRAEHTSRQQGARGHPPIHSHVRHRHQPIRSRPAAAPTPQEFAELTAQFKRQELLLYQYCEEKVTLAHHALDLVTQQQKDLERVSVTGLALNAAALRRVAWHWCAATGRCTGITPLPPITLHHLRQHPHATHPHHPQTERQGV
jgi:hypothetical protein